MIQDDIITAVINKGFIRDPLIASGNFIFNNDEIERYSGGYSIVFPVLTSHGKLAFRCWHADFKSQKDRYQILINAISKSGLPYFCNFSYEDNGIFVLGKTYPTVRMDWVEGLNLKEYIIKYKNDKSTLINLADNFVCMVKELHKIHFAHGDLQHGNILVDKNGGVCLIDYDSCFCSELKGYADIITGLDDYQHPSRKINKESSEKLDYFSELIIYLSILGIAKQPQLADKYKVEGTEALLFQAKDFVNITASPIYKDLMSLGDDFNILLKVLEIYLEKTSIDQLEPFYKVSDRISKEPVIKDFKCNNGNIVYLGDLLHFEWNVQDASIIYFNDQNVFSSNSIQVTAENLCKFQLKAINFNKQALAECKINIIPKPKILFSAKATKLRKGKDVAVLQWNITDATSVRLFANDIEIPIVDRNNINKNNKGIIANQTIYANSVSHKTEVFTRYELSVVGLDGQREFHEYLDISVHEESNLHYFYSDKQYSFPGIPVTLSWKIDKARDIFLTDVGEIGREGRVVVTPDKATIYQLTYSDAFGNYESSLEVKMLPIPLITAVLVPTPMIEFNSEIHISMPIFNDLNQRSVIEPIGVDLNPLFENELFDIKVNMSTPELNLNTTVSFIEPKFQLQKINFGKRLLYALNRLKKTVK